MIGTWVLEDVSELNNRETPEKVFNCYKKCLPNASDYQKPVFSVLWNWPLVKYKWNYALHHWWFKKIKIYYFLVGTGNDGDLIMNLQHKHYKQAYTLQWLMIYRDLSKVMSSKLNLNKWAIPKTRSYLIARVQCPSLTRLAA